MSNSKLLNYLDKPLVGLSGKSQSKYAIIVSSSKGNYLKPHCDILESVGFQLEFACKPGATFPDRFHWLRRNLQNRVYYYTNIVLFVWIGTCDLTKKTDKFIELKHDTDEIAVNYCITQIQRFLGFVSSFPTVEIVFLEIPPYSISRWNAYQGHQDCDQFKSQDLILDNRVILVNEFIRQVNSYKQFTSPKFRLDVTRTHKSKGRRERRFLNFALFKDGIHPKPLLARYWMKRIVSKVCLLCS